MNDLTYLAMEFAQRYPDLPAPRLCRAPGRVNLIGEHVDYCGLPVLPMTLDRSIHIAYAPRDDAGIVMREMSPAYPEGAFTNGSEIEPSESGHWENYCKAAVQGLNRRFDLPGDQGMALLVDGDLPVAAGLSSSTALVVACGLAYLDVAGIELDRDITRAELAEALAEAERFTGTQGGCMDHGILMLGGDDHACKLDFNPLRAEPAPLLEDFAFVVCHSRVVARKSGAERHRYNAGPRLARLVRALVERHVQETFDPEIEVPRIGDLWQGALCLTHHEAAQLFEGALPHERTPLSVAASILELGEDEIRETMIGDLPEPEGGFPLRARARHYCTEYARVEGGRDALLIGDAETFGRLMNESHRSCAEDYDVSGPELDQLVAAALEGGAIGSRLTGAGFGGCTVSLVPIDQIESFQSHVQNRYYTAYLSDRDDLAEVAEPVLIAQASPAAGYIAV